MLPPLSLDVALTPSALAAGATPAGGVYIVVDVIRATTTLCAFFERGARRVLVAPGIEDARSARDRLGVHHLLAGEVGGARPPGFDLGNAPSELATWDLRARELIFATTNGTRALHACRAGRAVFAGSFRNAAAVVRAALVATNLAATNLAATNLNTTSPIAAAPTANDASEADVSAVAPQLVIVCSGRGALPAFDDTLCAGYLIAALLDATHAERRDASLGEGARIALSVWRDVERGADLPAALASSDAGRAITSIGLGADLEWCAAIDATSIVPVLTGEMGDLLAIEPQ